MASINSYMFRHMSATFRKPTKIKDQKANTPIPILIILPVIIKPLTFKNHSSYI